MLSAGITIYDNLAVNTAYSPILWWGVVGWSSLSSISVLLWFHELYPGGPNHVDKVYSDYNLVQLISYGLQLLLTGVSAYFDRGHPVSFVTNLITVVFGVIFYELVKSKNELEAELEAARNDKR
ncbi:MAG: hypothetical protein ACKO96_11465 [Flammeovirgaceae bacterium]